MKNARHVCDKRIINQLRLPGVVIHFNLIIVRVHTWKRCSTKFMNRLSILTVIRPGKCITLVGCVTNSADPDQTPRCGV